MHHNYQTHALVLARTPLGEANALLTLLTNDLGLIRARAQGVRKPSAKLAAALATFAESSVTLVRGSEGWRVTGATLVRQWHRDLSISARSRASRMTGLVLRLVPQEHVDTHLFSITNGFFEALSAEEESLHDAAECLAALRVLNALGLDAGAVPGTGLSEYTPTLLTEVAGDRAALISRINRGITASGL